MPVMDGFEATRAIRKMFPEKRVPIIALSANAFDEDRRKSLEAGMDGHLAKPVVIAQLEDALKKYLRHCDERRETRDERFIIVPKASIKLILFF